MKGVKGGVGDRNAAGDPKAAPVSPLSPGWKALQCAFVNRCVKTSCKYPRFIYMTWSSSAKCKAAYLQAWGRGGAVSFRDPQRGWEGSHKVIWQFLSSWAWLDLLGTFKNNHVLGVCVPAVCKWAAIKKKKRLKWSGEVKVAVRL